MTAAEFGDRHRTDVRGTTLTAAEVVALHLVACGRTNAAIGRETGVSMQMAQKRVQKAAARLGARDRSHAVVRAIEEGYLPCPCPEHRRAAA